MTPAGRSGVFPMLASATTAPTRSAGKAGLAPALPAHFRETTVNRWAAALRRYPRDPLLLARRILDGPAYRPRGNRDTLSTTTRRPGAGRAQERRLFEDQSSWKSAG